MKLTTIILLLILISYTGKIGAQFYSTGEPPASLKWSKISTEHYKLIYPSPLDSQASRMANLLEFYYPMVVKNRGALRKIPVVLHNASVVSNGFVTLAPERMELIATPPVETYAQDWLSQLALHESQHIAQLNCLNQGVTRLTGFFTGEISRGIVASMIPAWLYEGEAVYYETRYSSSGRGRNAGFIMPLRTLILDRPNPYSFDKAVFGSYKDYVPDPYQYGYAITRYGISAYGSDLWTAGFRFVARNPFMIWPLAFYLKKNTGLYKAGLYKAAMDSLKIHYNNVKERITYNEYLAKNDRDNLLYTNYTHPHDIGNGNILAFSQGLSDAGSIVVIGSDQQVKRVASTGRIISARLDCFNNIAVWDEIVPDPRWEQRIYSIIRIIDLKTRKIRSLTNKTRYFSPAFSPDGQQLCVVEITPSNLHFLVILNVLNGKVVHKIKAAGREIKYPLWLSDSSIAVVSVSPYGKGVEAVNTRTGSWETLISFGYREISDLARYKQFMLFRSDVNKVDNVFALSLRTDRKCYQVTQSMYGAYYPGVGRDSLTLLFSEYSAQGFNVAISSLDSSLWIPVLREAQVKQTPIPPIDTVVLNHYRSVRFRKMGDVFDVHSWLPFYADIAELTAGNDATIASGLTVLSQNKLGTVISSLGYSYFNGFHRLHPSISLRAWYPVFEFNGQIGGPRLGLGIPAGIFLPDNAAPYTEFTLAAYVPLLFSRGDLILRIRPQLELERSSIWYYQNDRLYEGMHFFHYKLNASVYKRMTIRNIYPKWGQTLLVTFTGSPRQNSLFGSYRSLATTSYLPGLARYHHFIMKLGMQFQSPEMYYIPINRISFPRGYTSNISKAMGMVSLNYAFSAAYPDWAAGPICYIKRVNMNIFYDHAFGSAVSKPGSMSVYGYIRSIGIETWADMHIIRFILPISAGIRAGYMPEKTRFFTELMLSVDTGIF